MKKILKWIDDQTEAVSMIHRFMREPLHKSTGYPHVFGSLALILFVVQALTGGFLLVYYSPSPENAYTTVQFITYKLSFGNIVRGVHHWAATGMMVAVGLHLLQVFLWGAYKKPRQVIWFLGILLLVLTFAFAFTGYLLPWDQKAYWATVVGTNIAGSVPAIGSALRDLLRGGESVGALTLTRFFSFHIYFLPPIVAGLIVFHIMQVRKKGLTPSWARVSEESHTSEAKATQFFWPHQAVRDLIVGVIAIAFLIYIAIRIGAPIEPIANPADTAYVPRPEWYYLWLFELLKYFPGKLEFVGGILLPTLGILGLILLPYLDNNPERRARKRPFVLLTCIGTLGAMTILGTNAILTTPHPAPLSPLATRGQRLFFDHRCQNCHGINGGGGTGGPDLAQAALRDQAKVVAELHNPAAAHPRTVMPVTKLSEDEVTAISAFIVSLGPLSRMPEQQATGPRKPPSHFEETWLFNHKFEVRKDPALCAECHKAEFCQSCHLKRKPESHLHDWMKFHSGAAQEKPGYCAVCHTEQSCAKCHDTFQHKKDWLPAKHIVAAKLDGKICESCHTENMCTKCHTGAKPASHVADWVHLHGKAVGTNTATCSTCHQTPTFCSSCHLGAKPKTHVAEWIQLHGKTAVKSSAACTNCHTQKMCSDCHQTAMPHPIDWKANHGKFTSHDKSSFCLHCHDQKKFCGDCH